MTLNDAQDTYATSEGVRRLDLLDLWKSVWSWRNIQA